MSANGSIIGGIDQFEFKNADSVRETSAFYFPQFDIGKGFYFEDDVDTVYRCHDNDIFITSHTFTQKKLDKALKIFRSFTSSLFKSRFNESGSLRCSKAAISLRFLLPCNSIELFSSNINLLPVSLPTFLEKSRKVTIGMRQ